MSLILILFSPLVSSFRTFSSSQSTIFLKNSESGFFSRDLFNLSGENRDEACGYNVSCTESDGYELQINASSFLDMRNGYICSGTMLNNERNDYTPYYWTAWHCIYNVDFELAQFDWTFDNVTIVDAAYLIPPPPEISFFGNILPIASYV